jgi:hypothetical protein
MDVGGCADIRVLTMNVGGCADIRVFTTDEVVTTDIGDCMMGSIKNDLNSGQNSDCNAIYFCGQMPNGQRCFLSI